MPEEPLTRMSFRDEAKTGSEALISVGSPLLAGLVDHADHVFERCYETTSDRQDRASLALYRHIIEACDGIQVLISEACSRPCVPILRSAFEAWLHLMYIMKSDYGQRSLAWLLVSLHDEIERKEMLDVSTRGGENLRKNLKREAPNGLTKLKPSDGIKQLKQLLLEPDFVPIEEKYLRLRESGVDHPYWTRLVRGGPENFQKLAKHLSFGSFHSIFYRSWSKSIHAFDASPFWGVAPNGTLRFKRLRDPEDLKKNICLGIYLLKDATKLMLKKFLPSEDFSQWEKEIAKGLQRLEGFWFDLAQP
jgi:hypothetical protein